MPSSSAKVVRSILAKSSFFFPYYVAKRLVAEFQDFMTYIAIKIRKAITGKRLEDP